MINSGQSQIRKKELLLPSNYGMPFFAIKVIPIRNKYFPEMEKFKHKK